MIKLEKTKALRQRVLIWDQAREAPHQDYTVILAYVRLMVRAAFFH